MRINYITLTLSFFVLSFCGYSQETSKDVTITASGSGTSLETATQSALRSAIEQAFGAFISSKTEMLNDQIVADEMTSVSSGNIKSFEILNQAQLPDNRWAVTLKTIVSVDKLTSFVQAKGVEVEIKGGLFALNIKQQLLNEESEIKAISALFALIHETIQTTFDFKITTGNPLNIDNVSENWEIPLVVEAIYNKNADFCANYLINTIRSISLSASEIESYKSLNKKVYPGFIKYNGKYCYFAFRKESSVESIKQLLSNWKNCASLFLIDSSVDKIIGYKIKQLSAKETNLIIQNSGLFKINNASDFDYLEIELVSSGQKGATFSWNDKKSLSQIEKMTNYSIKPLGVISRFKGGGYVITEKDGHGLIAAPIVLGDMRIYEAATECSELVLNGKTNWRLPTKAEFQLLEENLFELGFWNISEKGMKISNGRDGLWTSTLYPHTEFYYIYHYGEYENEDRKSYFTTDSGGEQNFIIAVRSF